MGKKYRFDEEFLAEKRAILEERLAMIDTDTNYERTRIGFALRRLNENQYGLCVSCGVLIDADRLNAIPETVICSDCALERARKAHQSSASAVKVDIVHAGRAQSVEQCTAWLGT